jgi:hypothetical protein
MPRVLLGGWIRGSVPARCMMESELCHPKAVARKAGGWIEAEDVIDEDLPEDRP